nr:hypothetical protein 10 [bacterium]
MANFSLPTETETETETETTTETDQETTFGGERVEEYEDYWKAISMVRLLKKSCKALGVAKVKDAGKSPWADHYGHFAAIAYGTDDEKGLKDVTAEMKGNLPKYKDEFEAPEGEFEVITKENADEFGLPEDAFEDDEDPIFVPEDYEAPAEVWYHNEGEEADTETAKDALEGVSGVGEARAEEALEALKDAGIKLVWA